MAKRKKRKPRVAKEVGALQPTPAPVSKANTPKHHDEEGSNSSESGEVSEIESPNGSDYEGARGEDKQQFAQYVEKGGVGAKKTGSYGELYPLENEEFFEFEEDEEALSNVIRPTDLKLLRALGSQHEITEKLLSKLPADKEPDEEDEEPPREVRSIEDIMRVNIELF